jgi:hypothetical protein
MAFMKKTRRGERGQVLVENVLMFSGVLVPLTFGIVYLCQLLWVWNSIVEFTRDGASYAATHCWNNGGSNVSNYMRTHVPGNLDQDQFSTGQADLTINYYSRDLTSGALGDFICDAGDCTVGCIPDLVTVHVSTYQFRSFLSYLGLPAVSIPDFSTTVPMESAGCDPEQGTCLP